MPASSAKSPTSGSEHPRTEQGSLRGTRLGWIDHLRDAVPWVDFEGNPGGPIPARLIGIELKALQIAASTRQPVVLMFDEAPSHPVLIGLIQSEPASRTLQETLPAKPTNSIVGQRVDVTAQTGLELRCGRAGITLDSLGRICIRGENIETRATGVNRLEGDEIELN